MKANPIALSFVLCPLSFVLSASNISTSDWGVFWHRPFAWPQSVTSQRTPGSDTFSSNRIFNPHVYPFLDGYDIRAYVPDNFGELPPTNQTGQASQTNQTDQSSQSPYHTNVVARLVAWSNMLERCRLLLDMQCGTNTVWGSSAMLGMAASNAVPRQSDFTWTENPVDLCYKDGKGTGWMPTFRSLQERLFGNEWYSDWLQGVAVKWGWDSVNLKEPGSDLDSFSSYISGSHPATPTTYFDDIICAAFAKGESQFDITRTYRAWYPSVATFHRALSLYDTTYFSPCDLVAITNETQGTGEASWRFASESNVVVRVLYGEPTIPESFSVNFVQAYSTNHLYLTNMPCAWLSPRSAVNAVTGSVNANGSTNAVDTVMLTPDDMYELIMGSPAYHYSHTYTIHARPGANTVDFWITDGDGDSTATNSRPAAIPPDGDYEMPLTCTAGARYSFRKAFDVEVQEDAVGWRYPSNTTYLATDYGLKHTFFRSYAATETYQGYGDWYEIDFEWGNTGGDWSSMYGYGYAASSANSDDPKSYPDNLADALGLNLNLCREVVGNTFDTDPKTYCGATDAEAAGWANSCTNWSAKYGWTCLGKQVSDDVEEYTATFSLEIGYRLTMDPPEIPLSTVGISVGGDYSPDALRDPRSVDTHVKGVIQANWDFPQLKRSN